MINTITISRDLFERLCEAAIEAELHNRWQDYERDDFDSKDCKWRKTRDEALEIRDGKNYE